MLELHAVRVVHTPQGDERQLHLKVRVRCRQEELVADVLVDTGAQVSLLRRGLFKEESLQPSCSAAVAGGSPQRDRRSLCRRKNDLSRRVIPDWEIAIFIVNSIDFRNNLINFPSAPFQRPCSHD